MPRRNLSLLLPKATALDPDPIITGLTADHRTVAPGHLYAALPAFDMGGPTPINGLPYIDAAIAMGATAVLAPTGTPRHDRTDIAFITVDRPEYLLSQIAARFYAAQPRTMAAVTGTNGKTSTAQFTRQLWALLGHKAGSLGTLGLQAPHLYEYDGATTPNCITLHQKLALLAENKITHAVMEASSHGLHQYRLHGVKLSVAGFTNLTPDHLNYHGSMANYRDAKLRLFTEILPYDAPAVLNADAAAFPEFFNAIERTNTTLITYGKAGQHLRLLQHTREDAGQHLQLEAWGTRYDVMLPLIGDYQIENALCAAAMVIAAGEPASMVIPLLSRLSITVPRADVSTNFTEALLRGVA